MTPTVPTAVRAGVLQHDGRRSPAHRLGVLLGFVLAVVVVGDLPVVHAHQAPGVYDEDCPLERLAAAAPPVPLSSAPAVPQPARALESVPTGVVTATARLPFASFEPRAPPLRVHI
jgi:hypothetical protein